MAGWGEGNSEGLPDSRQYDEMTMRGDWYVRGNLSGACACETASDRNLKNSIAEVSSKYDVFFDNLKPSMFKYNDGTSGRTHLGFIAQEVKDAADVAEIDLKDLAAVCIKKGQNDSERWTLRYDEFVALNTLQIQKLKKEIADLKAKREEYTKDNESAVDEE